jgi:type IV pilus biogenesis protein CpaD/CtpE
MMVADRGSMRMAGRRWAIPVVLAGACMLLCACGGSFMDDTPETEIASGCGDGPLGCVTRRNIAVAAAKPSDLVTPRHTQPRDTRRRDAVMAVYRQGGAQGQKLPAAGTASQEGNR